MKFSIIIPVYNVAQYLPACLDSVFAQTYSDYEVVCVNDDSTDDSLSVLEQYAARDARINVISQSNGGLSAARNTGLVHAQGDYVFFLDSDDWIEPDALKILSEKLSDEDMVCFSGRRYLETENKYEEPDKMELESDISGWEYYQKHALESRKFAFVCVVLRLYRRQFLQENKLKFTEGIYHEDNMFTPVVCYYAKKVKVISDCLYDYRVRGNSIMTTRSIKHNKDILYIANTLSEFFVSKSDVEKTVVYRALTQHYQSVFKNTKPEDDKVLLPMVNWELYKTVSRTKMRHRMLYLALKVSPKVFRCVLNYM